MADQPLADRVRAMHSVELAEALVWSRADHDAATLGQMERELASRGDAPTGPEALLGAAYARVDAGDIGAIVTRTKKLSAQKRAFLCQELDRRASQAGGDPQAEAARAQAALVLAIATRRPVVTNVLLGAIAVLAALSALGATDNAVTQWGVLERQRVDAGQFWRLGTSMFLHFGILHLLFNGLALRQLGAMVEAIYRPARYLALYLLSGLAGNLLSLLFVKGISAGASGAIFGLLGATVVFGLRNPANVPPQLKSRFGTGAVPLLLYNVVFGLTQPQINNYAHVGGLLCGAAMALLLTPQLRLAAGDRARRPDDGA